MPLAHITKDGFFSHSIETDAIGGEGTFTPLPPYDPTREIPVFAGTHWVVVPLSMRDNYVAPAPTPMPQPVPSEVTPAQAKIALYDAGLYGRIKAIIDGSDAYEPMRIWWESALVWRLDNPNIHALAAVLKLTDDQVDDLFRAAAKVAQ